MTDSNTDDMTEDDLEEWKAACSNVTKMTERLQKAITLENEYIGTLMNRFTNVLAEIAMVKDDENLVANEYGKLYRWQWQYEKIIDNEGEACCIKEYQVQVKKEIDENNNCLLSDGWRWMLQIKANNRWWDWVYIKQSHRVAVHLGLFAGRDFPKGSIIGFYVGSILKTCDLQEGPQPCHDNADSSIVLRNRDGIWQVVAAKPVDKQGAALYLGMHYIKSACHSFKHGSSKYNAAKKMENCIMLDDGSIQVKKKISKNMELLACLITHNQLMNRTSKCKSKTKRSAENFDDKAMRKKINREIE